MNRFANNDIASLPELPAAILRQSSGMGIVDSPRIGCANSGNDGDDVWKDLYGDICG
ncbi:MAG: hypothetical protein WC043_01510 [Pseudobdellovibrionaceae bacterium]